MAGARTASAPGTDALATTLAAMRREHGPQATAGLADPLLVGPTPGPDWLPTSSFASGANLPVLLDTARRRWGAAPHAAATLAWKSYCYWVALPAVLSWAAARRVPVMDPGAVTVRVTAGQSALRVGFTRLGYAVLPDDPLAERPGVHVVDDETALLRALKIGLIDRHLDPVATAIRDSVHVGRRTLWGSVASGIAYGILQAGRALPGDSAVTITTVLDALGLAGLIDLEQGSDGAYTVHRRTCCLAFTLPQPRVCSGCCLR